MQCNVQYYQQEREDNLKNLRRVGKIEVSAILDQYSMMRILFPKIDEREFRVLIKLHESQMALGYYREAE